MPLEHQCTPYHILIYQLPDATAAARMSIWRALKRLGALPLQQSAYILPGWPSLPGATPPVTPFDGVARRIADAGGTYHIISYPYTLCRPARRPRSSPAFARRAGVSMRRSPPTAPKSSPRRLPGLPA